MSSGLTLMAVAVKIGFQSIRINPGQCGRHHTQLQMIDHRLGVAGLTGTVTTKQHGVL